MDAVGPIRVPDEADIPRPGGTLHTCFPSPDHPGLVVLGRETWLGNGSADLIAEEQSGRIAVIEVKLLGGRLEPDGP